MTERYVILEEIGRGGSGVTFLVYDKNLNQKKVLKKVGFEGIGQRNALEREIEALKKISHNGVPTITDTWIEEDAGFLVMEYCPGDSLAGYRIAKGEMNEKEIIELFRKIVDIVLSLHTMNPRIIHGDLKPENIVVTNSGVKLLDFGASYIDNNRRLTRGNEHSVVGFTPGYASAMLCEEGIYSIESDIYALGMILFFLITGRDVRSYPLKRVGVEDLPVNTDINIVNIFAKTIAGYSHSLELMEDINGCVAYLEAKEKRRFKLKKKELIYGEKKAFWQSIMVFTNRIKNRKKYKRLESVLLTDGGKYLFGLLLCASLLVKSMTTVEAKNGNTINEKDNVMLPVTLMTQEGERYILRDGSVFVSERIPILEISDRMIEEKRDYSIMITLTDEDGNEYKRTILCHKG